MNEAKKIKVGVFSDVYYPMIDGVVKVLEHQITHLSNVVDFYLIVPEAPKDYEEKSIGEVGLIRTKSVKVFFLDYKMPTPKWDRSLKKKLEDIEFDLVLIHSPFGMGKYGLKWAKKLKIPSIIYAHSLIKQDFKRAVKLNSITAIMLKAIMKRYAKATRVVAVGEGVKKIYLEEYGLKNEVVVINNATDLKYLEDQNLIQSLKQQNQIENQLVFSFIGRINKLKGIYLIADALKIVKEHNINYKMIFIGDGLDLPALKQHCEDIGIYDNCIFTGVLHDRDTISAYLNISDLFLFPSKYDTNSLVQKEAASQKTPTLFVNGATTAYGLEDGVQCFMADDNVESYADKIIYLANNRQILENMKQIVYDKLYQTWEDSAQELYKLMIRLIDDNKRKKVLELSENYKIQNNS